MPPARTMPASQTNMFDMAFQPAPAPEQPAAPPPSLAPAPRRGNYRLAESQDRGLARGWKERARDNVRAISLSAELASEGRAPTDGECAELLRFIGFGASDLANGMFRSAGAARQGWEEMATGLERSVTPGELASLARSTQYAHYTPEGVARAMWATVELLGFKGGDALEPGCGTGLFMATVPRRLSESTAFTAIENEPVSARIARLLYPEAWVATDDFTEMPDTGPYALAIGNPPFSDLRVQDKTPLGRLGLSLHDYFIARSLSMLAPGGLGCFVTSRYSMDKSDAAFRQHVAATCDLVAAARMPSGAMALSSGTDVIADVLVFRRRHPWEAPAGTAWQGTAEAVAADAALAGGAPALLANEHFARCPKAVLGEHARVSSRFGPAYGCVARNLAAIPGLLTIELARQANEYLLAAGAAKAATLPGAAPAATRAPAPPRAARPVAAPAAIGLGLLEENSADGYGLKDGSYVVSGGKLMQVRDRRAVECQARTRAAPSGMAKPDADAIRLLVPIRNALRRILDAQKSAPAEVVGPLPWEPAQRALGAAYDAFARATGHCINHTVTYQRTDPATKATSEYSRQPYLAAFRDDPDCWLVASIEAYDAQTDTARKGAIFAERVLSSQRPQRIGCAADALPAVLRDTGRVDMARIASLSGTTEGEAARQLGDRVFQDPADLEWEPADKYLSGKVRQKLSAAEAAEAIDRRFTRNVEALRAVQPKDLKPSEISAGLGSPWIPAQVIQDFVLEAMGIAATVLHDQTLGTWDVDLRSFSGNAAATQTWGTDRRNAGELLLDALNSHTPTVRDAVRDGDDVKYVINPPQTEAARAKLEGMKAAFEGWIWQDADRSAPLVETYNLRFNNLVTRRFDGSHLTLDDSNLAIRFYENQRRTIWRVVCAGSTYIAHHVGSGKTFTMIAAIMEQRRLGLVRKPMLVVPNHCLAQISREFMMLYPLARVLVADEANMEKRNRLKFMATATTGEWDCVVITHSAFSRIPMSSEFQARMLEEERDLYQAALLASSDGGESMTRKRLERAKEGIERKIKSFRSAKDNMVTLCDMGIDQLIVDEAHEFRKLSFPTNRKNIKGISPDGSKRAWDLFVKSRYTESVNPGRGLILSSGTPITNTIGELYTVMRLLANDELMERGVHMFDAWASTFGKMKAELELQPSGKYKRVDRFCEFVNLPELINLFRSFADIVLQEELGQYVRLPRLATGQRQIVTCEPTAEFLDGQSKLAERILDLEARSGAAKKGEDNILTVIGDGRLLAIDPRMLSRGYGDDPGTKLNVMIQNVHAIYEATKEREYVDPRRGEPHPRKGATQIIFSDLGVPGSERRRGFSAYEWIRKRLVELGVPAGEIAFMQDHKKSAARQAVFNAMNAGAIRIVVASTQTMATGANAQDRLVAIHHLDEPFLVSSIGQREGRGVRQGNQNDEIHVLAYVTAGSMDATMWQLLKRKATFINAIMSGDTTIRRLVEEDGQAAAFAYARAMASGDPRLLQKAGLEADIDRLERLKKAHSDTRFGLHGKIRSARHAISSTAAAIEGVKADLARRTDTSGDGFRMTVGKTAHDKRKEAGEHILSSLDSAVRQKVLAEWTMGTIGGFDLVCQTYVTAWRERPIDARLYVRRTACLSGIEAFDANPVGLVVRMENALRGFEKELASMQRELRIEESNLIAYEAGVGAPFELEDELRRLVGENERLDAALAATGQPAGVEDDAGDGDGDEPQGAGQGHCEADGEGDDASTTPAEPAALAYAA